MDHKDLTSAFYLKTNKFVYKYSKFINCKDDKKLNIRVAFVIKLNSTSHDTN